MFLDKRVQLLDDNQVFYPGGEIADKFLRQWIGHTQFQERCFRENLPGVLVGDTAGDNAQVQVFPGYLVQRKSLGEFSQFYHSFLYQRVPGAGIHREHHVFLNVIVEREVSIRYNPTLIYINHGFGMGDASCAANEYRGIELFADIKGVLHQVVGFLAVAGLQNRHLGQLGIMAIVLLVLRAVYSGVVSVYDDQPGIDPCNSSRHKRVARHVKPHVLHGCHGAYAGVRSTQRHFHSHLFIGRPFCVYVFKLSQIFQYFGARSSRIGGSYFYTCVISTKCESFVSRK